MGNKIIKIKKSFIITLYLALVSAFFFPVIFQGKVIAPLDILESLLRPWATAEKVSVHNSFLYDTISYFIPYEQGISESFKKDGYMGWYPYSYGGRSFPEDTMSCPGDWHHQLYRWLPFWDAWNWGIILQYAIAGLGMLVLLRSLGIPPAYALVGVVAFGFYSQFILWTYHRWVLGAMCWSPWMVWALLRAAKKERIFDFLSVIFIALAFRGGHLQAAVFVVLLAGLLFLGLLQPRINTNKNKQPLKPQINTNEHRYNSQTALKTKPCISSVFICVYPWFQKAIPLLALFAVSGILGAILSIDVWIQTIHAYLEGGKDMTHFSFLETLMTLPHLVTTISPMALGTPQGIDAMKFLNESLFDIKFAGAVAFLLAFFALFRREAPLPAKLLFIVSLIIPFTPADNWLYSRSTVIFALGLAWLATWMLYKMSSEKPSKLWKWVAWGFATVVALWGIVSIALFALRDKIFPLMTAMVTKNLPANKDLRLDWMLERTETFFDMCLAWHPLNIAMLVCIALGIWACLHINHRTKNAALFAVLLGLTTFGEIFVFSSTWMTFSKKPANEKMSADTPWMQELKSKIGNGAVHFYDRSDFDYMQLNTPAGYDIRQSYGYGTVIPKRIEMMDEQSYNPADYAAAGIAAILVPPGIYPEALSAWEKVMDTKELVLYRNPAFTSVYQAEIATTLQNGLAGTLVPTSQPTAEDSQLCVPLQTISYTPNTRELPVPVGTKKLTIAESYNKGWHIEKMESPAVGAHTHKDLPQVQPTENYGMEIVFAEPISTEGVTLLLQYRPPYQKYYLPIILLTLLCMIGGTVFRKAKARQKN